jgi:hypothetical protein
MKAMSSLPCPYQGLRSLITLQLMRSSWISIREARRMGFNGASVLALAVVLLSFLSVDSFSSNQRLNVRSSSTTVYMAGGRVPLVPYFLGRER